MQQRRLTAGERQTLKAGDWILAADRWKHLTESFLLPQERLVRICMPLQERAPVGRGAVADGAEFPGRRPKGLRRAALLPGAPPLEALPLEARAQSGVLARETEAVAACLVRAAAVAAALVLAAWAALAQVVLVASVASVALDRGPWAEDGLPAAEHLPLGSVQ